MQSHRIKLLSATVGAGAVLAMGGLTVAFSTVSSAQPEPAEPGPVTTSTATLPETSTESTAPPAPTEPAASPTVTATSQPEGFAETH
jgi:hypothetical protein